MEHQADYLQLQDDSLNIGFSKRTLQRDIREIRNLWGVDIEYSAANKGYFISQGEMEQMNFQRMIEAFDMFHSLNLSRDIAPFIYLEKRKPQGTENLYGLLHAIKNKLRIRFSYQKYWEDKIGQRTAEPYGLKEFKSRWYLMAKDLKDDKVKSFALDRLTSLEISQDAFTPPKDYDIEDNYRYSFGIINPDDEPPQEIVLSFDAFQGKYIKSLPLHDTQQVLVDNDEELQIRLKLRVTHDLIMELLSYGSTMKVLKPEKLIAEIKQAHKEAYEQYTA
jgi:proteasome accessory factor B